MPGTAATGSTEVALVDSRVIASLCDGKIYVDATPTVYIANGDELVLGANVEIVNPYGIIVKPYGTNYEIAPALSGGMDAVISFNIPTQAGNYQYGTYTVNLQMYDSTGASWIVSKPVKLCEPDRNNKTRNYGSLSAQINGNCVAGKVYILIDNVPTYNGALMESQVLTGTLEYPTGSGLSPLTINTGNFSVALFEGVYKVVGEICATYNFGDNVYVKVKYKIKKEKNIRCIIDRCCVLTALKALNSKRAQDCSQDEINDTFVKTATAINLLTQIELSANCGEDPSDLVEELEELLGCVCTCNCADGTPIIGSSPSSDVIIEGCNVDSEVNGNTTTYTINNYSYVSSVADNGGALVVTAGVLDGCIVTQTFTFNIAVVYSQIKTLANQNNTEADFWASVINKSLRDIDPACLGLTTLQWQALSYPAKWAALVTKLCLCCGTCDSTITDLEETESGNDTILTWEGTAYLYEIWLDGVLVGTILTSASPSDIYTHTLVGANDGTKHTWLIISKCSNGAVGQTESSKFQRAGCPEVPVPIFSEDYTSGTTTSPCPFDLTSVEDVSNTNPIEWHTAYDTTASTLVTNPAAAGGGSYYAFAKDGDCFSPGKRLIVICTEEGSCTAPQNLQVVVFGVNNFFVKFQSAAYPPPANSYTVYRRLASAPDISGSYTTIGTPVWNASLNRWVIADLTAVDGTYYIYKAESNCTSTTPGIQTPYVNISCPTLILYPSIDIIDYSFVPIAGANTILVDLLDSTGTTLIHTDTYTPAYANPRTGTFTYLTGGTTYKVRLRFVFTSGSAETIITCTSQTVTTDPA
jgi:hypothetical protein